MRFKLADEIEAQGIERVIYGKGHAELVKLNVLLVEVLRNTAASEIEATTAEAVRRILLDYDNCGELLQATLNYARAAVAGVGIGPAPRPRVEVVDVQPTDKPSDAVLDALEDFVQEGCSARPEDKHQALQAIDLIRGTIAKSASDAHPWRGALEGTIEKMAARMEHLQAVLDEACTIALAISGHFCENQDEWLRELQKLARSDRGADHG